MSRVLKSSVKASARGLKDRTFPANVPEAMTGENFQQT